ncbi:radical SAM/SPASM domain-containing protein [Nannocystis radixulma]|uniref:Radical SAM protein n=1 Tax=Nannocystis radixulma TaxID=2995305 RepID=A0ABT5BIG2_9BACT|nr:radical SAM protein [Nannocystis radixulma]MDC0672756.1 radical SAM protein [Nannocystis radixulma]
MSLNDVRKRLPVVSSLPAHRTRAILPVAHGETPRPRLAVWEFTLACDQACIHCGPRAGQAREGELTTEEALKIVDELAEAGVGEVVLIGGEAYLRNDFILVIRKIRERGMEATMTTGGYNLGKARAEAMVEAGICSVSVSIDGLEDSHDRVRNRPGSWQRAFAALRHLRAAGARVAVNSQINVFTLRELEALLELVAAEGVHSWQLQITVPHGNAADHPEILLQPYMYLELFDTLDRVMARAEALKVRIWPANNLGYFGPHEERLRGQQKRRTGHYSGCEAGRSTIAIESDGQIKNCPSLGGPTNIGGSWRDHGLWDLWTRAPEMSALRTRTLDDLWGYCRECYYASVCMAGCTAVSEPVLGRPGNNPFCHHRALEMDRMGLRERIEFVRKAPDIAFGTALFRVVREHKDPALRAQHGPVATEEPRISRLVEPSGPGRPEV